MKKPARYSREGQLPVSVLRKVRIPFVHRAALIVGAPQDESSEDVFILDLGLGGAFVERSAALPLNSTVLLRFCLPGNEIPLELACRVGWWRPNDEGASVPSGLGLQFQEVSTSDGARLEAFLREYLGREIEGRRFHKAPSFLAEEEP